MDKRPVIAIEPFDKKSPCPKCEGRGLNGHYCTTGHARYGVAQEQEHIDVECQWCGYVRVMYTADLLAIETVDEQVAPGWPDRGSVYPVD